MTGSLRASAREQTLKKEKIKVQKLKLTAVIQSMRGPFLVLSPVCIFLGVSTVVANQVSVDYQLLVLALLGALLAHISVNTLNEYLDFKSGLDLATTKTPFSGGSGALPKYPEMARAVFAAGAVSLLATILIGVFLAWKSGSGIMPIGVSGLVLITATFPFNDLRKGK